MPPGVHPYFLIPLTAAGLAMCVYLFGFHLWMLLKPESSMKVCKGLSRNFPAGAVVMGIAMAWFWLLVAPKGMGPLSALSMELGDFNKLKPALRIIIPLAYYGVITQVKEFLFPRGLGALLLMAAAPLLYAAFLKDPSSRLLVSVFAYAMIIKGLFFVGMPYLFRDGVDWATKSVGRWKSLAMAGLIYGVLVLICALTAWRGH